MKLIACIYSMFLAHQLFGVPIETIHSKISNPISPIGGIFMAPLFSEIPGDDWPETISITLDDGSELKGSVIWIELKNKHENWTISNDISIDYIHKTNNTMDIHPKDTTTGPVVCTQLPPGYSGKVTVGSHVIEPIWFELPDALPNLNLTAINDTKKLSLGAKYTSELSQATGYWRATLLASRKGMAPSPFDTDLVSALVAKHQEQIWRIAMNRLAKASRGVAAECRDLLTNIGFDGDIEFACWVTESENQLLSLCFDQSLTPIQLASRALQWCERQQPFLFWLEQVYGDQVVLAISNPTLEPILLALKWRKGNDVPLAIEIPPKETSRVQIPRIEVMDLSIFGPETAESSIEWLELQIDQHVISLPIVPKKVIARPPGVTLPAFYSNWTLPNVRNQKPIVLKSTNQTSLQLRKVFGRWEFFFSCQAHVNTKNSNGDSITVWNPIVDETIRVKPSDHTNTIDGWDAVVEIPDHWIVDSSISFSAKRDFQGEKIQTIPLPTVPWFVKNEELHWPAPIVVDVSKWDEITFPN